LGLIPVGSGPTRITWIPVVFGNELSDQVRWNDIMSKRVVALTSSQVERVEVSLNMSAQSYVVVNQVEEKSLENVKVVCKYRDVFLEELAGMPHD
jgi:hypothetical protein